MATISVISLGFWVIIATLVNNISAQQPFGSLASTLGGPITPLDPFNRGGLPRGIVNTAATKKPNNRAVPHQPQQLSVELLIFVDKKARDEWTAKMPGTSEEEKEKNAIKAMREFLNSVVHGVNELYVSLSRYGLFLDIRIVDIRQEGTFWTKEELLQGNGNKIAANTAIDTFYRWSWNNRRRLPPFDHALLITGYDIVDHEDINKPTTGVAYKGVMCRVGSISLVENSFSFQLVHDLAHELGHSLGCDHDGESNNCRGGDGYIMSIRPDVNSTNRWYFSPCSADSIKEDLALLDQDNENCLRGSNLYKTVAPQLGTILNADRQCSYIFGDDAYFCRDFYDTTEDYHQMCSAFWCSESHNSSQCVSHIASDGFLCGDSMICVRGKCVKVNGAPRVLDWCPQGDQPGIAHDGLTCADIVRERPWECYDDFYRRKCCVSCNAIKTSNMGCEYGDKEDWCKGEQMNYPFDCYLNNQTCCDSCAQYLNVDKKGCEYGDHSEACLTDLDTPLGCYWNEALCCDTCVQHKNLSRPDCEFGDRSTWCSEKLEVPNGCYLNKDLCCATCEAARRPDSEDCPYGDRYPKWCPKVTPYRCYNETIREWCCDSCPKEFDADNTGCEYGDRYKNCDDLIYPYACYHPMNQEACCNTCSLYNNTGGAECLYGDRQAWCWKLTLTYDNGEWCPLDEEKDHCCGTCRYNSTAVPVFGYRLKEEGLEQVTLLGNEFRDKVRAAVLERRREEEEKAKKAQESKKGEDAGEGSVNEGTPSPGQAGKEGASAKSETGSGEGDRKKDGGAVAGGVGSLSRNVGKSN